ncbi:MAG: hypothetical protein JSU01_08360 [Bacteroidetes bacterium]|nr:hypothetical protein [Bacteroidota bacterium]
MKHQIKYGLLCFLMIALFACKKAAVKAPVQPAQDTTTHNDPPPVVNFLIPSYNPSGLDTTKAFTKAPVVNSLERQDLVEVSGVAASRLNPGILYIQNDGGNPNQVYMIDGAGANKGTLNIPEANRDWEDIAVGPGPVAGKSYFYLGDIGDNHSAYSSVIIYRFEEPDLSGQTFPVNINVTKIDTIKLKYPDGPRNAETLMVDPNTKDIYIASKQSNFCQLYVAHYPQSTTSTTVMTPVVKLYFDKATGGDISPDGTEILLRSNQLIWYWKLPAGTSILQGLLMQPEVAPYANNEPQGEGIGFAADGSGYYTDTEIKGYSGKLSTISFYKRN